MCSVPPRTGWYGYLGATGDFLAISRSPDAFEAVDRVVALGEDGTRHRTLLRWAGYMDNVASDVTGDHLLLAARRSDVRHVDALYRWSRGEEHPTKLHDGIVAAVWIPNRPRPTAPALVVAVTNRFHLVVLDARDGHLIRTLAEDEGTFRGDPGLAVSPDGSRVYYTAIDAPTPGCRTSGIESVFSVPIGGGPRTLVGRGRTVAVDPSSGAVAFSRDYRDCTLTNPGSLEIRGAAESRVLIEPPADACGTTSCRCRISRGRRMASCCRSTGTPRSSSEGGTSPSCSMRRAPSRLARRGACAARRRDSSPSGSSAPTRQLIASAPTGATRAYGERAVVLRRRRVGATDALPVAGRHLGARLRPQRPAPPHGVADEAARAPEGVHRRSVPLESGRSEADEAPRRGDRRGLGAVGLSGGGGRNRTHRTGFARPTRFEDEGGHQTPFTSAGILPRPTSRLCVAVFGPRQPKSRVGVIGPPPGRWG